MSKITGKALVVITHSSWEIILQDENDGMPGGDLYKITAHSDGSDPCLVISELVPKEII